MGIDSKAILQRKVDDNPFQIAQIVEKAIRDLIRDELKDELPKGTPPIKFLQGTENNKFISIEPSLSTEGFYFKFKYKGEDRSLCFFTNLSCSTLPTNNPYFYWSLSCWGSYDEIMKKINYSMNSLGTVLCDFNDCDETGYEEVI